MRSTKMAYHMCVDALRSGLPVSASAEKYQNHLSHTLLLEWPLFASLLNKNPFSIYL
jgi:hypothetical protein